MEYIKIELSEQDAEMFKLFRQYQDSFQLLIANKVFSIKNGKAILNFDKNGALRQIDINRINWRG